MCQTGWGGYSQGMLALAAAVAVSGLLPIWLLWGWVWYTAHQLVRHQTNMPKSGKPQELLDFEGISRAGIVKTVKTLL